MPATPPLYTYRLECSVMFPEEELASDLQFEIDIDLFGPPAIGQTLRLWCRGTYELKIIDYYLDAQHPNDKEPEAIHLRLTCLTPCTREQLRTDLNRNPRNVRMHDTAS